MGREIVRLRVIVAIVGRASLSLSRAGRRLDFFSCWLSATIRQTERQTRESKKMRKSPWINKKTKLGESHRKQMADGSWGDTSNDAAVQW